MGCTDGISSRDVIMGLRFGTQDQGSAARMHPQNEHMHEQPFLPSSTSPPLLRMPPEKNPGNPPTPEGVFSSCVSLPASVAVGMATPWQQELAGSLLAAVAVSILACGGAARVEQCC